MATAPTHGRVRGPHLGPRALLRRLSSGDEIARLVTLIFALLTVLITGMLVYQLWVHLGGVPACVRLAVLRQPGLGPGLQQFWRAAVYLRDAGHLGVGLIVRRASGLGRGHFSGGACAPAHFGHSDVPDRSAGRRAQRDLRFAGRVHSGAADAHRDCSRRSSTRLGFCPCSRGRPTASAF